MRLRTALAVSLLVSVCAPAAAGTLPARVRINEIGTHFSSGCDLIELRVIDCGSMEGISLFSRFDLIIQFTDFYVSRGDLVMVHLNPTQTQCSPGAPGACAGETAGPATSPASGCPSNFDTAYDWHTTTPAAGLPPNHTVIWAQDVKGAVMDAVCLASSNFPVPPAGSGTEAAAGFVADQGEWQRPEGGVPPGGFTGMNYGNYAVRDLFEAIPIGNTIQRIDNSDDHHMGDWTTANAAPTWGRLNVGQSAPIGGCAVDVEDGLPGTTGARLEAWPSVTRGSTAFHLAAPLATGSRLEIFDAQGRATRVLWWWAGSTSLRWDGRDGWGREAAAGLYFARVITPRGPLVTRVTRTR